jgi:hypothetical protein
VHFLYFVVILFLFVTLNQTGHEAEKWRVRNGERGATDSKKQEVRSKKLKAEIRNKKYRNKIPNPDS